MPFQCWSELLFSRLVVMLLLGRTYSAATPWNRLSPRFINKTTTRLICAYPYCETAWFELSIPIVMSCHVYDLSEFWWSLWLHLNYVQIRRLAFAKHLSKEVVLEVLYSSGPSILDSLSSDFRGVFLFHKTNFRTWLHICEKKLFLTVFFQKGKNSGFSLHWCIVLFIAQFL
jgi:hypothetical protein